MEVAAVADIAAVVTSVIVFTTTTSSNRTDNAVDVDRGAFGVVTYVGLHMALSSTGVKRLRCLRH